MVLGVEKILHSKLIKRRVNRRIMNIDLHAGMVIENEFFLSYFVAS